MIIGVGTLGSILQMRQLRLRESLNDFVRFSQFTLVAEPGFEAGQPHFKALTLTSKVLESGGASCGSALF